jgi:hypothetical protein
MRQEMNYTDFFLSFSSLSEARGHHLYHTIWQGDDEGG